MHIPDGYLGPTTCGFFYVVMLPIWALASKVVKKTLKAKQVPLLAIGAAFSFVIMNCPCPVRTNIIYVFYLDTRNIQGIFHALGYPIN